MLNKTIALFLACTLVAYVFFSFSRTNAFAVEQGDGAPESGPAFESTEPAEEGEGTVSGDDEDGPDDGSGEPDDAVIPEDPDGAGDPGAPDDPVDAGEPDGTDITDEEAIAPEGPQEEAEIKYEESPEYSGTPLHIFAGGHHSFVQNEDGSLWSWGGGKGPDSGEAPKNLAIPLLTVGISDVGAVSAADMAILASDREGSVFGWWDTGGQEENEIVYNGLVLSQLEGLSGISGVCAGDSEHLAVSKSGDAILWQAGKEGPFEQAPGVKEAKQAVLYKNLILVIDNKNEAWVYVKDSPGDSEENGTEDGPEVGAEDGPADIAEGGAEGGPADGPDGGAETGSADGVPDDAGTGTEEDQESGAENGEEGNQEDPTEETTTDNGAPARLLEDVKTVSAAGDTVYLLQNDGSLWSYNTEDMAPDADSINFERLEGLDGVASAIAGENYGLALKTDGTVWIWGDNEYAGPVNEPTPAGAGEDIPAQPDEALRFSQVQGLAGVIEIAAGKSHFLALKEDGSVWGWGDNSHGGLGDFLEDEIHAPVLLIPGHGNAYSNDLTLKASKGRSYYLPLEGSGILSFEGVSIKVAYDPGVLQLIDAARHLSGAFLFEGPAGGGLSVMSLEEGEVVFAFDKDIPPGKEWSGLVSMLAFKALKDGETLVSVSWEN